MWKKCSEMQEYAKKFSEKFVRVSSKTCQKCIVISKNIKISLFFPSPPVFFFITNLSVSVLVLDVPVLVLDVPVLVHDVPVLVHDVPVLVLDVPVLVLDVPVLVLDVPVLVLDVILPSSLPCPVFCTWARNAYNNTGIPFREVFTPDVYVYYVYKLTWTLTLISNTRPTCATDPRPVTNKPLLVLLHPGRGGFSVSISILTRRELALIAYGWIQVSPWR